MSRDLTQYAVPPEPGLRVALSVKLVEGVTAQGTVAVRVDVMGAARPVRISVYLDGELIETWAPAASGAELRLPLMSGRRVITARAFDARGRWGGAFTLIVH